MSTIQYVNGFPCKTCTDVDNAKKHINPADPKDGPYGIYAKDPGGSQAGQGAASNRATASVVYGGALSALNPTTGVPGVNGVTAPASTSPTPTATSPAGSRQAAPVPPSGAMGSVLNLTV
jgi:hypothetical protein